jgi:hypothetical protein
MSTTNTGSTAARMGSAQTSRIRFAVRPGAQLQQLEGVEADIGGRDEPDIAVHDMDDLVRRNGRELVVVQPVDQPAREDEDGVLPANAAGEAVHRRLSMTPTYGVGRPAAMASGSTIRQSRGSS